ncbi:MAG: hypothetical protein IKH57_11365 [Clostridia bacterium]|nr:hypothetical protein [Clostridia bacterium]
MKKYFSLLLALALVFSCASCAAPSALAEMKEVTILAYVCGSDLESDEGEASGDIREMISSGVGGSNAVTAIVATGGSSRWQSYGISSGSVQYYRLGGKRPELLKDAGRRNMGDADTLSEFLRFGISAAPAKRYILILWDHGGGPVFGVCNDENYRDDSLSLAELRSGLLKGLNGARLDIIGFDCCLMNCVDLCHDMYGIADYSVVSQELVSGTGLNYDEWMKPIVNNPGISTQEIAVSMAQTYVAENARGRSPETATMSVIASGKMPAVMDAANAFSASLSSLIKTNLAGVVRLRRQLTSFGEFADYDASDLVDVEDMCDAFSALLPKESAELKKTAKEAVCYNCTTSDIAAYAHGLSFFLPYETIRSDKREILAYYSGLSSDYATLAVAMTNQASSSGYAMSASNYTPSNFFSWNDSPGSSCSGSFCDIWDGWFGDYCSLDDAYDACGGNIWSGLNTGSGSIWDGFSSSTGIWEGYSSSSGIWGGYGNTAASATPSVSGIWAGMPQATEAPAPLPSASPAPASAAQALTSIWQGLLNSGNDYYQPGEQNQNVQTGVSEAVSPEEVVETAGAFFSSATLSAQMVYSIQLNKNDLDHLSAASGVLSVREGTEVVRLGNLGETTIDWSTGLVFSMFDGSWPMLGGRMVRAEFLYGDEKGNVRFVIPARVNGLKMYLLGCRSADGETELLGATQGYDENGFAIRGHIPLEAGMTVCPLFTAVSSNGSEREYEGEAITVPEEGLSLAWSRIPAGNYLYCFGLADLSGQVHYTDSITISF